MTDIKAAIHIDPDGPCDVYSYELESPACTNCGWLGPEHRKKRTAGMESATIVPNPGSDEAIRRGCVCPRMDNNYGQGYRGGPGFAIAEECRMHGQQALKAAIAAAIPSTIAPSVPSVPSAPFTGKTINESWLYIGDLSPDAQEVLTEVVVKFRAGAVEHGPLDISSREWGSELMNEVADMAFYAMFEMRRMRRVAAAAAAMRPVYRVWCADAGCEYEYVGPDPPDICPYRPSGLGVKTLARRRVS